jgi:hypothetical protein
MTSFRTAAELCPVLSVRLYDDFNGLSIRNEDKYNYITSLPIDLRLAKSVESVKS